MSDHDWPDPSPDSPGEQRWKAMTGPRTAAGRALLDAYSIDHYGPEGTWLTERILAIEAEAAAPASGLREAQLADLLDRYLRHHLGTNVEDGAALVAEIRAALGWDRASLATTRPLSRPLQAAVEAYLQWHKDSGMGDPVTPTWQRMKDALAATPPIDVEPGPSDGVTS